MKKKSSRRQPKGDPPPLTFDQNIEPVPFADPSSALPSQKESEGEQAREKSSRKGPIYEPLPAHSKKSALAEGYKTLEDWQEVEAEKRFPGLGEAGRKLIASLIPETPEEAKHKERLEKQWSGNRLTQELLNWDKREVVFESVRNDVRGALFELPLVADGKPEEPKAEEESGVVQRYKSFESLVYNLAFYGFELLCYVAQDKDSGDMLKCLSPLARNGDFRARATIRAITAALTTWGTGPPTWPDEKKRSPEEILEGARKRQRRHKAKDRDAEERVKRKAKSAVDEVLKHNRGRTANHRKLGRQAIGTVLEQCLNSSDAAERRVAKKIKARIERALNRQRR